MFNVTDDSQNKNKVKDPKPTDNIQSFLKLMDEIGDQPNTILLQPNYILMNLLTIRIIIQFKCHIQRRKGWYDNKIWKHVDLSQDYLQNMMNNRMYVDDMNRWKELWWKRAPINFINYTKEVVLKVKRKIN